MTKTLKSFKEAKRVRELKALPEIWTYRRTEKEFCPLFVGNKQAVFIKRKQLNVCLILISNFWNEVDVTDTLLFFMKYYIFPHQISALFNLAIFIYVS